ncbi:MAG TPA: peptide deformylase [Opitutaceae bacterium]|nr:peptide deformylase [Opitutaceae bacterium]
MPSPSRSPGSLHLRVFPAAVLRRKSEVFDDFGTPAESLATAMLSLMRRKRGIGLAAPQVGLSIRLLVADIGEGPVILANPELVPLPGGEIAAEGCLSLPGVSIEVERARAVEVAAVDLAGKPIRFLARGLLARVLQHETDHLDGILIIDRTRSTGVAPVRRASPPSL